MNKITLHLTNIFGNTYAAVIVDRIQCATFIQFNKVCVTDSITDDFNFAVDIDNAIVSCHEIEIKHPTEKKEWYFGFGACTGEVNGIVEDWLSLFRKWDE